MDSIEHFIFCPVVQAAMPGRLKVGSPPSVDFKSWFLFTLSKPDKLLMALYVHAFYTMHNQYRHNPDRGEFRLAVEKIILDIPLRPALSDYLCNTILPFANHRKIPETDMGL